MRVVQDGQSLDLNFTCVLELKMSHLLYGLGWHSSQWWVKELQIWKQCLQNNWNIVHMDVKTKYKQSCTYTLAGTCCYCLTSTVSSYGHGGTAINLTTHFLGRLRPFNRLTSTQCTFFASNWQLPFLNQRKGENDRRKDFMINLNNRMVPDRSRELAISWSPVEHAFDWATGPGSRNM